MPFWYLPFQPFAPTASNWWLRFLFEKSMGLHLLYAADISLKDLRENLKICLGNKRISCADPAHRNLTALVA